MYSIFIGYNIEICTMTKYILELEHMGAQRRVFQIWALATGGEEGRLDLIRRTATPQIVV